MLLFFGFISGLVGGIFVGNRIKDDRYESLEMVLGFIFAFVGGLLGCLVESLVSSNIPLGWKQIDSVQIYSIGDKSVSEGGINRGYGTVQGNDYYTFYRLDNEGAYVRGQIPVSSTKVYEFSAKTGLIVVLKESYVRDDWVTKFIARRPHVRYAYVAYVPVGTIGQFLIK